MKKILFIAYYFPPDNNGGTERLKNFYYKLKNLNYDTYVLTKKLANIKYDLNDTHIIRVNEISIKSHLFLCIIVRFIQKIKTALRLSINRNIIMEINCKRRLKKLIPELSPDVCFVTYPPVIAMNLGIWIKNRFKTKVVCDFRDGMVYCPIETENLRLLSYKKKYLRIEKEIISKSDLVITALHPLSEYLQNKYSKQVITIPNGYDDKEKIEAEPLDIDATKFNVLYTGGIDSSKVGLFEYAQTILRTLFSIKDINFIFVGDYKKYEKKFFSQYKNVKVYSQQPRGRVVQTQKICNLLLLITGEQPVATPGKLYEYLFSGVPVLNIGKNNNTTRILQETGCGESFSNDSIEKIESFIRSVMSNEFDYLQKNIDIYTRDNECLQLKKLLDGLFI